MATPFDTIADRLVAAGYKPTIAADLAAIMARLAGKLGAQVNVAGGRSLTVMAVDAATISVTFSEGGQALVANAATLASLFGIKGAD